MKWKKCFNVSSLKNVISTYSSFLRKMLEEGFQQNKEVNQRMENPLQGNGGETCKDDGLAGVLGYS